jgi:hypothetical protein
LIRPKSNQAFRLIVAKGPQQHGVNNAEDRGIGANPERERNDRDRGEGRPAQQAANSISDIFK